MSIFKQAFIEHWKMHNADTNNIFKASGSIGEERPFLQLTFLPTYQTCEKNLS